MPEKKLDLSETTLSVIERIGGYMPGGLFVYEAVEPFDLLYANREVWSLFGCSSLEEFESHTGYTFRGMVHPDDFETVQASIDEQIAAGEDRMDHVEYRIVRKDGAVRWIDDYGHFAETKTYGGIYIVFVSDITDAHELRETDVAVHDAVISTLTNTYNTVWLINDVETESCSLYHSDMHESHTLAIRNALSHARYTDTKTQYVDTMVAEEDKERMQVQIGLPYILEQFETTDQFSVSFVRALEAGPRHYRIDFGKVYMPGGRTGVMMGFKDVEEEYQQNLDMQRAILSGKKAEEENRRLVEEIENAAKLADLMGSIASLLSNMPAMSFSKDAETGKYLACNQAFAEYAGKAKPEEVIGLTDFEIFDAETAAHFVEDDKKALAMDGPYIFFEDVPDATGSVIRNLQTTKLKFRDASGILCTLGMCVDVAAIARMKTAETKQQEMQERLELQEKLLEEREQRARQDSMIVALSADYRSVYYVNLDENEAECYLEDRRFTEAPTIGEHFAYLESFAEFGENYVAEPYREGYMQFIQPENIRAELLKYPVIAYRFLEVRDGRETYSMLRMAGVRHVDERDDNIVHAIGVGFTDIDSEMRQNMAQQQALSDALAAAEQANKAKTAFLSNMSHEIRTPMNAIIGLDSLALRSEELDAGTREYLEKIGDSARHLLGLINDILDMSRIESGRMTLRKEEFSFRSMLEQINTMVMSQCSERGLTYECTVVGGVSDFYIGDDMKLKQVLINILSNAIKFTEAPGRVMLSVERTAVFEGQTTLRFKVKDTGIGMDESFLPRIFDSFAQENAIRTNEFGSTGLGMAITKNIVQLMNGTISVESEKGVGTEFTVVVTLRNCDVQYPVSSYIRPKDMHVLIVDDEEIAAEHARVVLEEVGIIADTSLSGAEALSMLEVAHTKNQPYNLVLLDWKMPEMDGLDVAREIRKRYDAETTVIILTSFNWDEIMDEALHIGVDSFLAKPLFASNVVDEFERIARKSSMKLFKERLRADLAGRRILLAEDIMINAEIIKQIIVTKGAEVDHAENGRIVVDKFEASEPGYYDAILMDVRMPEMDGLEAAAAIRASGHADAQTIPIIALTANAFDEDVQRSLQVGMNAHLSKPVEPEQLYRALEELIWEAEDAKR